MSLGTVLGLKGEVIEDLAWGDRINHDRADSQPRVGFESPLPHRGPSDAENQVGADPSGCQPFAEGEGKDQAGGDPSPPVPGRPKEKADEPVNPTLSLGSQRSGGLPVGPKNPGSIHCPRQHRQAGVDEDQQDPKAQHFYQVDDSLFR